MTVDPLEIEDTSDWLGCPTELETCRHYLRMLENEVQELTLQLRKAREDIFGLVEMHADVSRERDHLRAELNHARTDASNAHWRATDIQTKTSWELMSKDKVISELCAKIHALTGADPFTQLPPR
ncbi:hypothetical protein [Pseudomonas fluorescens]|uniref:Uncharacterized protein n=1 Tax=Pseudomonas fluorescens TaxID=294 RepID=A0A5E7AEN5_PSEFL|nr:hypothetical protein [Pseudomonas fluorescens]VVN76600.1 hypothetical protein PS833_00776 [Pseudomonas fluorescens]